MEKNHFNNDGIALVMVIILLVSVSVLVGVLINSELFNIFFTNREVNQEKAFYLAEAGGERIKYLYNKYGKVIFKDNNLLSEEEKGFLTEKEKMSLKNEDGYYRIEKISNLTNDKIDVKVLGEYKGSKKILGLIFDLKLDSYNSDFLDDALFAAGGNNPTNSVIKLTGSSQITGDVKTNISDYNLVELSGSSAIDGDFDLNYQNTPPENIRQEKQPGDEEWSSENSPYSGEDTVWYDGLYYEARYYTDSYVPGTHEVWQVKIPEGENWPWFKHQIYDSGDKVWYKGELYTAQNGGVRGQEPDSSNGWERQIPNVSGEINYTEKIDYPEVKFPDFPQLTSRNSVEIKGNKNSSINKDGYYEKIKLNGSNDLIINRKNEDNDYEDRVIRVNNLDIQQGNVKFANSDGEGKLIIYVEDSITFGGSSTFGSWEQKENVIIHYAGDDDINFKGSTKFYGSLNVKNADINLGGSNAVNGHIFSNGGDISISGAVSMPGNNNSEEGVLIYALNSNLTIDGSGSLQGSAVVKNIELAGGTSINHIKPEIENYPFIEEILNSNNDNSTGNSNENKIIWYNK